MKREPPHDEIWHEARMQETAWKREAETRRARDQFALYDKMPEPLRLRVQELGMNRAMLEQENSW